MNPAAAGADRLAPVAARGADRVSVMLKLTGAPVSVATARAAGNRLSAAESAALNETLERRQAGVVEAARGLGGKILATYQVAYNGVAVQIGRDRVDELGRLPNVESVRPLRIFEQAHQNSMPLIKVPTAWGPVGGASGFRGEGMEIGIIDSGIDYTHANFGGPGEKAAYLAEDAKDTLPPTPLMFDPSKFKGGFDFVGDRFDPSPEAGETATPQPDPNPLDCAENGHGSHVAGSATGFGVVPFPGDPAFLTTYRGPYDSSFDRAKMMATFKIAPGVAPLASLYGLRVFGCEGSTTEGIIVDAIEWALDPNGDGNTVDRLDVINMSLGSPFGAEDEPSSEASTNAARAGLVVVTSAGNSGPSPYITGAPGVATGAISVAANDPVPSFPAANGTLTKADGSAGGTITVINANGEAIPADALRIVVLKDNPATPENESLGCRATDYPPSPGGPHYAPTGIRQMDVAVTVRGACARVARAVYGEMAGYEAVIMINNSTAFPPVEGKITGDPGILPLYPPFPTPNPTGRVTIPFLGLRGCSTPPACGAGSEAERLLAADGGTVTLAATNIVNPGFKAFASFTSGGPRMNDSWLKPDVTAPGVSILSTDAGEGNEAQVATGAIVSGTSMAAPHVAGLAALSRQAHPAMTADQIKATITNTAEPAEVTGYSIRLGGSGQVQADRIVGTTVTAHGDPLTSSLSFGFHELTADLRASKTITLRNHGAAAATFTVGEDAARRTGAAHSLSITPTSVTVPAGGQATVNVSMILSASLVGNSAAFREAGGHIVFTPATGTNAGIALRVPYYVVPRSLSNVRTALAATPTPASPSTTANVTNAGAPMTGTADFFAWGLEDGADADRGRADVRAVGVQSFPEPSTADPDRRGIYFAVNAHTRWSHPSINEFDIYVDVDNDGISDYIVIGVDIVVTSGSFAGTYVTSVASTRSPGLETLFLAPVQSTDSSTVVLRVRSDQLCRTGEPCLSKSNPRISYGIAAFDLFHFSGPDPDVVGLTPAGNIAAGSAKFNVWSPSITQGVCLGCTAPATAGQAPANRFNPGLEPNASASTPVSVDAAEWAQTPQRGLMVVTLDNRAGADEAQLLAVPFQNPAQPPPVSPPPPVAPPPVAPPPPITNPPPPPRRTPRAARCVVPRAKGMPLERARRAIRRGRCTVGPVRRAYSKAVPAGRVISQSPRAGARRPVNTRVALLVSRGARRAAVRPPFTG